MRMIYLTKLLLIALLLLALVPGSFAQCALCKTSAEAQGPEAARSINLAILVLLTPTLLLFFGVLLLLFSRRNAQVGDSAVLNDAAALDPAHHAPVQLRPVVRL